MTLAVCPGSFDPITLGHVDVVRRATTMFDDVVLAVAHNSSKRYLFDLDQRLDLARDAVEGAGLRVRVEPVQGLLADFCRDAGASAIVKGLRGGADFDAEQPMALMNRALSGVETVFVIGDGALAHVASSLVKDVARHQGSVAGMVTPAVAAALAYAFPAGPTAGDPS